MSLSGNVPIRDIQREADASVRTWLTFDGGVVHGARFVRTRRGWRIIETVSGVA